MPAPVKYEAGESTGVTFETGITRTVVVSDEALDKSVAYLDETVVYTATVVDDQGDALPTSFIVDLLVDGTKVVDGQALDAAVYDPGTKELTLSWTVPAGVGTFTVKLSWAKQLIQP